MLMSTRTLDLLALQGKEIAGTFRITNKFEDVSPNSRLAVRLDLEDATGFIYGAVLPDVVEAHPTLPRSGAVAVRGLVSTVNGSPFINIRRLRPVGVDEVPCAAALLPKRACPEVARDALLALINLELSLTEPLAGFLRRVLLDRRISFPLLRAKATLGQHHSVPGGLLVHSTEYFAEIATAVAKQLPNDPESVEIAQVAYFLHDFGRMTHGAPNEPFGVQTANALATFRESLLEDHLVWLSRQKWEVAGALDYILEYSSRAAVNPQHPPALYVPAEVVVAFDRMSSVITGERDLGTLIRLASQKPGAKEVE